MLSDVNSDAIYMQVRNGCSALILALFPLNLNLHVDFGKGMREKGLGQGIRDQPERVEPERVEPERVEGSQRRARLCLALAVAIEG
jgi:hypothetical protein